ncbi:MAG: divergent polysaccharide deacetylase family protein [Minwuia sp.]|nr:divergent polysaccharide deacetylase family protein [Minwuia sp.]
MADRGPKTGRMPLAQIGLLVATVLFLGTVGGTAGWLMLTGDATPAVAQAGHGSDNGHDGEKVATGDHAAAEHANDEHETDSHAAGAQPDGHETAADAHGGKDHAVDGHTAPAQAASTHANDKQHAEADHAAPSGGDGGHGDAGPMEKPADGHEAAAHDKTPPPETAAGQDDRKLAMAPAVRPQAPRPPPALPTANRKPLSPAPDPAITSNGRYGPLPIRSPDGRLPWQVYARPFDADIGIPRIAIVVTNMGLAEQPTLAAIQDLPGEVTLAFSPYSGRLAEWVPAARAAGHEVLLQLPMEPRSTEFNDPGNKALLTANTPEVNEDRMEWVLSRAEGYVGLTNLMGSRFTVSPKDMQPVLASLDQRGLLYIDSRDSPASIAGKLAAEMGLPSATNDRFIDAEAARGPIDARLAQLEQLALARGSAVGFAADYPVAIERLRNWISGLEARGFVLAPVSAVVRTAPPE